MTTVSVIYFSGAGHTAKLAEAVAAGAAGAGAKVNLLGVMGQARQEEPEVAPNGADKLTAESLGRRVAQAVQRWNQRVPEGDAPIRQGTRRAADGALVES